MEVRSGSYLWSKSVTPSADDCGEADRVDVRIELDPATADEFEMVPCTDILLLPIQVGVARSRARQPRRRAVRRDQHLPALTVQRPRNSASLPSPVSVVRVQPCSGAAYCRHWRYYAETKAWARCMVDRPHCLV